LGKDQAADEGTYDADHDIKDDALLTICPHDDTGEPSDNAGNDELHDNSITVLLRSKTIGPQLTHRAGNIF
jgi:hypothetical protein